jgi:hypothetical protein
MNPATVLNAFIADINYAHEPEGSSISEQVAYYIELLHKNPSIKNIIEIFIQKQKVKIVIFMIIWILIYPIIIEVLFIHL